MRSSIRQAENEKDWDFFFNLSFETLKLLRKSNYDQLVSENPGKSDAELLMAHRKEVEDYADFSDPKSKVFIAENDAGEYIGYLWMGERKAIDCWDFQKPQWIFDVVVLPKFRGNGLGRLLMQQAEKFAVQQNRNLGLLVHEDNKSAINLYKSEGYLVKNIPMSLKLGEIPTEAGDYMIREGTKKDIASVKKIGLISYTRMVRLSKDIPDEEIRAKYDEYHEEFEKIDRKKCTFVIESADGSIAGYILVMVPEFSDKVGLIYDSGIASEHKSDEIVKTLITRAASWCKMNSLSTLYYLLHVEDDISQQNLQDFGFVIPAFFMEKVLFRTLG